MDENNSSTPVGTPEPPLERRPLGPQDSPNRDNGMKKLRWIIIAGIALAAALIAFVVLFLVSNKKNAEMENANAELALNVEKLQLSNEQLRLTNEYEQLNSQFESVRLENQQSPLMNDSIAMKYIEARDKVQKLIQELNNEKTRNAAQIQKLQDEISTLKNLLRHYIEQINELQIENAAQRDTISDLRNTNRRLSNDNANMTQQNRVLNERMTLAEKLNVSGLTMQALNKKGKNEKKIKNAYQLKVSFQIPQNNSTPVGEKVIYLRIVSPEGNLLGNGGNFTYEGASLPSTARKTIEYEGLEIPVDIYWDNTTSLTAGTYTVELFCDNYRIASKQIEMN